MKSVRRFIAISLFSLIFLLACDEQEDELLEVSGSGSTSVNSNSLNTTLSGLPLEMLSQDEIDGLYFMREEEKLAHDVYTALYDTWSRHIFINISNSEQTHTDAVLALINRYELTDPVGSNAAGVFANTVLQSLHDSLIVQGSISLIDALLVGAAIEEIDILDIQQQLDDFVDNQDITLVYENLMKGSRNHLRAYVSNLASEGMNYTPQYLSQQVYDDIINSPMETN